MRLSRLGEIFALKYKVAADPKALEASLRNQIKMLWKYTHELFNVLEACANEDAKGPTDAFGRKALEGHRFCKKLLTMIDYLQSKWNTVSLGEMREVLHRIVKLIDVNKNIKFDAEGNPSEEGEAIVQFPHVSALVDQMFEAIRPKTKQVVRIQKENQGKARTGLSRIAGLAHNMLETLQKLEIMVPEQFTHVSKVDIDEQLPERFTPQRAPLGEHNIIDFIRQHGNEYGISSQEDWQKTFENDEQLRQEMTTVINALNRGHYPRGSADVKMRIAEIMRRHEKRKSNLNAPL
jgi:translation initiation factor 1 (eIF-1/SUI1)